jgi:hypothetical protein
MNTISKDALLAQIQAGWDNFNAYLGTLSEAQLSQHTDAAGWAAIDHLTHIAFWEGSIPAMLKRQPYRDYLAVDEGTFLSNDIDQVNAVIRHRYQALSSGDVLHMLRDGHQRLIKSLEAVTDEDLQRSCRYYQPDNLQDCQVLEWVLNNSIGHYEEHTPWIKGIIEGHSAG